MTTLVEAWTSARDRLKAAGVESPVLDARLLVEAAAGAVRADILSEPRRPLTEDQTWALEGFVSRRERREPISQILGRQGFWKLMLKVTADVLTPRPETELVVETALSLVPLNRAVRMLDLGVGSGAILLAILAERPEAVGLGVDVSEDALAVARDNAAKLGLEGRTALLRGDWTTGLSDQSFDLVVSNPPYVRTGQIETLDPEVRDYEPRLALDGGPDGLAAYRLIAPEAFRVLKPGGSFIAEIGHDQGPAVLALFTQAGFADVRLAQDFGPRDRVVSGVKKPLGIRANSR